MTGHFNTKQFTTRYLAWDEENRLMGVADNNQVSFYLYDAAGERTVKFTGHNQWVDVNGMPQGYAGADKLTLYASPYLVATSGQYTKHYYAGEQRIVSKIGGGGLGNFHYIAPVAQDSVRRKAVNLENRVRFTGELLHLRTLGVKPKYSAPCNQEGMLVDLCNYRNIVHPEEDRYFYHPDHLGSSSWITDREGVPVQHLAYLPFGEEFVDQRTSDWNAMYKFSGKEKDQETGYNYFGARYYDSDISIFTSVDPLSDKYPHQSNYVYCSNRPINVIDPDGRDEYEFDKNGNFLRRIESDKDHLVIVSGENRTISRDFDKGTFNKYFSNGSSGKDAKGNTIMDGLSRRDASGAFNFMSDNTNVEWGRLEYKDQDGMSNFMVGTSHSTTGEGAISDKTYDLPKGSVVRYDHSHPFPYNETPVEKATRGNPSTSRNTANPNSKDNDEGLWNDILSRNPNAILGIRYNKRTTIHHNDPRKK